MAHIEDSSRVTLLLRRYSAGDCGAHEELFSLLYEDLRYMAGAFMRRERPNHTMQPTALVHEAYMRLIAETEVDWQSRAHFMGVAALVMRRIIIDYARAHRAEKRGAGAPLVMFDDALGMARTEHDLDQLLTIDEALTRLAQVDERQAKIAEMKFFAGLTGEEIGLLLGMSERTVKREWSIARAWLRAELRDV
jgi:RNA polymerase sigma factor (TIGR02999 family)